MVSFLNKEFSIEDNDESDIKIVNTTAVLLQKTISKIYALYTKNCNVPEEHRWLISMKNEFMWTKVLFTSNKKSYASNTKIQEGVMIPDTKALDIKGLQIKKSSVNKEVSSYLTNILEHDILKAENIDVPKIVDSIENLEGKIKASIANRETSFSQPFSVKTAADYKDPFTIYQFKAVAIWNEIMPSEPIVLPDNVNIFKIKGEKLEQIEIIKDEYPEIYETIKVKIFEHVKLSEYGIKAIALPKSMESIPEWLIPLVDVETIIKDNISVFAPVLNSINLKTITVSSENYFSNIIEI